MKKNIFRKVPSTLLLGFVLLGGCEYTNVVPQANNVSDPSLSQDGNQVVVDGLLDQVKNLQDQIAASNNQDLINSLQSQIEALQDQIEELENDTSDNGGNNGGDNDDGNTDGGSQAGSLQVIETLPVNGATIASSRFNADITVTFDQAIALPGNTLFSVVKQGESQPLAGTLSVQSNVLIFNPSTNLSASSTFNVVVKGGSAGVKSVDGSRALQADKAFLFRTGSFTNPGVTPLPPDGIPGGDIDIPLNPNIPDKLPPIDTNPIKPINPDIFNPGDGSQAPAVVAVSVDSVGYVYQDSPVYPGTSGVTFNSPITLNFSGKIDLTSVMTSFELIELKKARFSNEFREVASLTVGMPTIVEGKSYIIKPSQVLKNGTRYRVVVRELKDSSGAVRLKGYQEEFVTVVLYK